MKSQDFQYSSQLCTKSLANFFNPTFLYLNQVAEPVDDNLMFNGEVEHPESPPREDAKEDSEPTTPSKVTTGHEDSKPAADELSDPQVQRMTH